jgi:hypothetical protein
MDARVVAAHADDVIVLWHQRGLSPKGARFDGEVLGFYTFQQSKLARARCSTSTPQRWPSSWRRRDIEPGVNHWLAPLGDHVRAASATVNIAPRREIE